MMQTATKKRAVGTAAVKSASAQQTASGIAGGKKGKVLISVSDKAGVVDLAKGLVELGYEIVSTGGSYRALSEGGGAVSQVESITNFPEMLDGRVKTLHPAVHGGILARRDVDEHLAAMQEQSFGLIDMVICNLYPFRSTVTNEENKPSFQDAIENIDIGGPTLIRAAAKNHKHVTVLVDPSDYEKVLQMETTTDENEISNLRKKLAWKAFQHVSSYDSNVAEWLWENGVGGDAESNPPTGVANSTSDIAFPPEKTVPLRLVNTLRYGENPHQRAAFYVNQSLSHSIGP
jgi:phosphoribosylaminoimidazolecarboxamide formyltransferase/IMP cyclohydrolase